MAEGDDKYVIPKLEDYRLSETYGFLLPHPLEQLPEYFQPWMDLAKNVNELIENGTIRAKVREMPLLDHTRLEGHKEKRLAQLALSVIGNSYVWATKKENVPKSVPKNLAIPWYGVSTDLGIKPHMNAVNATSANTTRIDKTKPLDLDNMKLIFDIPGGKKCNVFILVAATVDMYAGRGLQAVVDAQKGVKDKNEVAVHNALEVMKDTVDKMNKMLQKTTDHFPVEYFSTVFQPFILGWGDDEGSPLKDGLIFEGVSTEPQKVIAYNEGQTPVFQIFDAALGIEYEGAHAQLLKLKRGVMLPSHRAFIEVVKKGPSIREFVMSSSNEKLKNMMNACIKKVSGFRTQHIKEFIRYSIVRKMHYTQEEEADALANDPFQSGVVDLLKSIRDQTRKAVVE